MRPLSSGSSFKRRRAFFQAGKAISLLLWLAALFYLCLTAAMAGG